MPAASSVHEFGSFRLDSAERLLLRAGQPVSMTPKAFDLLVYLVDHAGRLVTKQALMSALWPDSFVEEANLTFTVSALRKALGDGQDGEQFIQTVPTRGYRFVAPVTSVDQVASAGNAPSVSDSGRGGLRSWALICAAALLTGAVIGGLAVWNLKSSPVSAPPAVARLAVSIPMEEEFLTALRGIAASPSGTHLVYVARRRGVEQLYVRALASLESRSLVGTEGARAPFFSPDGHWVGFFAEGKLKRISITGGAPQTVCDGGRLGGTWAQNNVIYFSGSGSRLWQVPAEGGIPQPFTTLHGGEISHRWPQALPGGQAVLFTSRTGPGVDEHQVQVQRVSDGERRILVRQGESGAYIPTGHLVYVRSVTGTLVAVPFDLTRLRIGPAAPVTVAEGILVGGEGAHYTWSDNGLLAYVAGRGNYEDRTLVWVDRTGKSAPVNAPRRPYEVPRLSPDGLQVAVMIAGATQDTWVLNLARGDLTRVIGEGSNQFAVWTPDGKWLVYRATRAGTRNLFWKMADGSGNEEQLTTEGRGPVPGSWSPNGQILLFTEQTATGSWDILSLRLPDRKTEPFMGTSFVETAPEFSPDGRWVAYGSDESGGQEIYVRAYPGQGGKSLISIGGGIEPVWNPNGRELFYRNENKLMAVDITTRPAFTAGKPKELFSGDYVTPIPWVRNFDVSRDGRFLMVQSAAGEHRRPTQIIVVLNWQEELKQRVPVK